MGLFCVPKPLVGGFGCSSWFFWRKTVGARNTLNLSTNETGASLDLDQ